MGVDHTNVASGSGRSSVRITSKKSYNHGLIILDVAHMPGGICGTWPAFWTVGPNWPNSGEIDIIEGVNSQSTNSMTLHTGSGCAITNNGEFTGTLATTNCNINAPGQATNAGCQINTPSTASFGTGFNADNGGVYVTEWTSEAISIWFFSRGAIPSDIASGNPDPTNWGAATAAFAGGCEIDSFFMNQQIVSKTLNPVIRHALTFFTQVFDTTFCQFE
jgi:Glycosyl hydrolases family 16